MRVNNCACSKNELSNFTIHSYNWRNRCNSCENGIEPEIYETICSFLNRFGEEYLGSYVIIILYRLMKRRFCSIKMASLLAVRAGCGFTVPGFYIKTGRLFFMNARSLVTYRIIEPF